MGFAKRRLGTLRINGRPVSLQPRETVLQAAERHGIALPNGCRVGACGTCKCRLTGGTVEQLTETAYLLSGAELDQGYVLACQSVPQSNTQITVDVTGASAGVAGEVVAQERVTHDIGKLTVQLAEPLFYRAGQFANLTLAGLPEVTRSYSFATPPPADGRLQFYVRKVPGGRLSTLLNDEAAVGRGVRVDGPHGDFWLRDDRAPLLLVAGGSGLAPLLALLHDALARGVTRPVTLVFGARTQRDLYALGEIGDLGRRWRGRFRFIPVLSDAADDTDWRGARGLVTARLAELVDPSAHAYLCGPPAMIDGALALLTERGMPRERIYFDRFTTQADRPPASPEPPLVASEPPRSPLVSALHYLKFLSFHIVGLFALAGLLAGGSLTTAALLTVLAGYVVGDALSGDDTSTPKLAYRRFLTAQLWLALPLLTLIVATCLWSLSSGDALGFGATIGRWTGYDVLAARAAGTFGHHLSACVLTGLMIGMIGTITAHELTHRTWDPVSMLIGRWLLAFSFDTSFAIEHVYGHHRYVSTTEDPATAPRGRNVYAHIVTSTVRGNISAWHIESQRLHKRRLPRWSWHNAVLRGHVMSLSLMALALAVGGWRSTAVFVLCGLWGKSLLEIVNYMEHYGIVRNPRTPVQFRHSWNTNRRISSWTMFNLTRHSHHHAQGEVPYHDLRPYPGAPMMINGYLTTLIIAMIPPLWHRLMTPKVLAWDRDYADLEERALAAEANAKSGIVAFTRAQSDECANADRADTAWSA